MSPEVTTKPDVDTAIDTYWLSQLKDELRITTTADDELLRRYLKRAYGWAERYLHRSLITQTLAVQFNAGEARSPITLPRPPVQSITSVKTYDDDGTETTTTSTEYRLEGTTGASVYVDDALLVAEGGGWLIDRTYHAVKVTYVAGYGAADADPMPVPEDIQMGILRQAATYWHFRLDVVEAATGAGLPPVSAEALLWPHRFGMI